MAEAAAASVPTTAGAAGAAERAGGNDGDDRATHTAAAIDALRALVAPTGAPVEFHFVQALARRAQQHQGPTRALLDARLARALAALEPGWCGPPPPAVATAPARRRAAATDCPGPSPLAELVQRLNQHRDSAAASADNRLADGPLPGVAPSPQRMLRGFQTRLARLSVDRQLQQSQARTPANAGPLNSQRLVLRALQRLRTLSPAYLDRFMSYADGLAWLEAALAAPPPAAASGPRNPKAGPARKPARRPRPPGAGQPG